MNESYVECLVARKPSPLNAVFKILIYGATAICVIMALFSSMTIMFIPAIAFCVVIYFLIPNLNLEFDYLYLDKEISIDKVMNKAKRKRLCVLDLNKMEFIAPENSHELDSFKSRGIKIKDYSSMDPEANKYILVYNGGNGVELLCMEPDVALLKCIKTVFPRKVREY